jgi:hypothetical protein
MACLLGITAERTFVDQRKRRHLLAANPNAIPRVRTFPCHADATPSTIALTDNNRTRLKWLDYLAPLYQVSLIRTRAPIGAVRWT